MMATEVTTENFEDVPNIAEPEQVLVLPNVNLHG